MADVATAKVSTVRKIVQDGVLYAELTDFFSKALAAEGFAGIEVRNTPLRTEIIIRASRTREVLGEGNRRIRELTSLVNKRFNFETNVELFVEKIANRALCAHAQAESLKFKLLAGLAVRRACYSIVRFVMDNGATGCEVIVSGKLRAQRAKVMKFKDGYLLSTGTPKDMYVDTATRNVMMRQGVLGVQVKIMLPHDPSGIVGPKQPLPDTVIVHEPKEAPIAQPMVSQAPVEGEIEENVEENAPESSPVNSKGKGSKGYKGKGKGKGKGSKGGYKGGKGKNSAPRTEESAEM